MSGATLLDAAAVLRRRHPEIEVAPVVGDFTRQLGSLATATDDHAGRRLVAFLGGTVGNFYVVVGRKRVEGVTPLRVTWRQRRHVLAGGVVEPSARTSNACCPRGE